MGGCVAVNDSGPEVRLRNWFDRPYDDAISAARTCYSARVIDPDEITQYDLNDAATRAISS